MNGNEPDRELCSANMHDINLRKSDRYAFKMPRYNTDCAEIYYKGKARKRKSVHFPSVALVYMKTFPP